MRTRSVFQKWYDISRNRWEFDDIARRWEFIRSDYIFFTSNPHILHRYPGGVLGENFLNINLFFTKKVISGVVWDSTVRFLSKDKEEGK